MEGWAKIFRKILEHWIASDPKKLGWWIIILLSVNWEDKKVAIGNKVLICHRGESYYSLRNWSSKLKTTPKTVSTFFKVLEKDGMIEIKNIGTTTFLKVCNWDAYQDFHKEIETLTTTPRKQNGNTKATPRKQELHTTKEKKNKQKINNKKKEIELIDLNDRVIQIFKECYRTLRGSEYIIADYEKESKVAAKLINIVREQLPEAETEMILEQLRFIFQQCITINDEWHFNKISLPYILNNINQLTNIIRYGNTRKTKSELDTKGLGDFVEKLFTDKEN